MTAFLQYTGTSTTDGSGTFTATWPAFANGYMALMISTTDPVFPGSILTPTTVTVSSYTGTLSHTDNLYPTSTVTPQAGVTFSWLARGY